MNSRIPLGIPVAALLATVLAPWGMRAEAAPTGACGARYIAPAASTYTALTADEGTLLGAANATGPTAGWAGASIAVSLPDPASVASNWTMCGASENNKAVIFYAPLLAAPASAPSLSATIGGTISATTYYVKITFVNLAGETVASSESSLAVAANQRLVVGAPASSGNATGWNVYVGTGSGSETKQNASPLALGANWTEPLGGLISGAAVPSTGTAPLGYILDGGRSLRSYLVGTDNFQTAVLVSDGVNFRIVSAPVETRSFNGASTNMPAHWQFLPGPGYQATQGDNGNVLSSALVSSTLSVTLPSITDIAAGWSIGLAVDGRHSVTVQKNSTNGGTIYDISGGSNSSYTFTQEHFFTMLQFDGAVFRMIAAPTVQTQILPLASAGGTANALTATYSTLGSLAANTHLMISATGPNTTTAPTLAVTLSGGTVVGPYPITKFGGKPLVPGDIFKAGHRLMVSYTGSGWEIINPLSTPGASYVNLDPVIGTSDDTATFTAVQALMAANADMPRKIYISQTANLKNFAATLEGLKLDGPGTLNLAASGGVNDDIIDGTASIEITDLKFTMPIYDPVTLAIPAGRRAISIASTGTLIDSVKIRDVRVTGGQHSAYVAGVENVDIKIINDRQEHLPIDIIGSNLPGAPTQHVHVKAHCILSGYYCVSTINTPISGVDNPAPRDIHVEVTGTGVGLKYRKGCLDLVSGAQDSVYAKVDCRNSFGGLDLKSTGVTGIDTFPGTYKNFDTYVNFFTHIDDGIATFIGTEPDDANAGDQHGQMKNRTFATYTIPEQRMVDFYYGGGEVVTNGGNTYVNLAPGVANGTAPTHAGITVATAAVATGGTGCPNGTQTFAVLNGDAGSRVTQEVVLSGTVAGGVLQDPLTPVSGYFWIPPTGAVHLVSTECSGSQPTATIATTGTAVVADGSAKWLFVQPTVTNAVTLNAIVLANTKYSDIDVTAYNVGAVLQFAPEGTGEIRNVTVRMTADNVGTCLYDLSVQSPLHPTMTVDDINFRDPYCHSRGTAANIGIANKVNGTDYITNYSNIRFFGGALIADTGSVFLDHYGTGSPAPASVGMAFYGTLLRGATRVFNDTTSPWTVAMYGGGRLETTDAANTVCVICTGASATANLTFTAPQEISVSNARSALVPDWLAGAGSTLTVKGRFIDGYSSVTPTAKGNWGQIFRSVTPGSGGQPVNGWYLSSPTTGWTAF